MDRLDYALALHGGAGSETLFLTRAEKQQYRTCLDDTLKRGKTVLAQGGNSLDAVETVIRALEDNPKFNAGHGSVLNYDGNHVLDACIMDGKNRACGAVAAVTTVRHPIHLARLVMTETEHVLLVGKGADQFAREMQVELVEQDFFRTEKRLRGWQQALKDSQAAENENRQHLGTVGCVARDRDGNLAAGTSTGGRTLQRFGRVGDSPIVGAGTFADNNTCAVSCTGVGERFIQHVVAYDISALMEYRQLTVGQAVSHLFKHKLPAHSGGIIAMDTCGSIAMQFNTHGMYRAATDSAGRVEIDIQ